MPAASRDEKRPAKPGPGKIEALSGVEPSGYLHKFQAEVGAFRDRSHGSLCTKLSFGYGSGHGRSHATMFRKRSLTAGIGGLAAGLSVAAIAYGAQEGEAVITCTNPISGTSWQIVVDYAKATVDSYPAEITRGGISWFDPKDGGNYKLDRKSGELTTSVASSTGGYFRHSRCKLEQSR